MSRTRAPAVLVICGPTSSGKSAVAIAVARALGGEIVNADSRQIYRGTEIGTGMPSAADRALVPHHLYGFMDPAQRYSAARFVEDADNVIDAIIARSHLPIVTGGTGFYIEALTGTMPLDRPPGDEAMRSRLHAELRIHPVEVLWDWLRALAPKRARAITRRDPYRIVRALETEMLTRSTRERGSGEPPVRTRSPQTRSWEIVALRVSRPLLRERITARVRSMYDSGMIEEAQALRVRAAHAPALSGLGYAESLALLDGLATRGEAIAQTIRRSLAYAKRQETWFRRIRHAFVVDADVEQQAIAAIIARARETSAPG